MYKSYELNFDILIGYLIIEISQQSHDLKDFKIKYLFTKDHVQDADLHDKLLHLDIS